MLCDRYGEGEARALVRLLAERRQQLSWADLLAGRLDEAPSRQREELEGMVRRVADGEPVQYVMGEAEFDGCWLRVSPAVLIPRSETADLCRWVAAERGGAKAVLDIGTGSGCIACRLAATLRGASVTGWDLSEEALEVARENAKRTGVNVSWQCRDALSDSLDDGRRWDVIVSNPPYICERERSEMDDHVVWHEPAMALFVPDDDPLRFYRAIGRYARNTLSPGGALYFEINPLYAEPLTALLGETGLRDIVLKSDQFEHQRFIRAIQP